MNRLWVRMGIIVGIVLVMVITVPTMFFYFSAERQELEEYYFGDTEMTLEQAIFEEFVSNILFGAFIGLIAGLLVSRSLRKSFNKLVTATQAIDYENLSHRVEVEGVKEFEDLAASFNLMIGKLEQAHQERRNLLADVSHELLTPLTVLEGNLRALLDGVYETTDEEISYLYDQTHHLIRLVKDLRQLAQAEDHQLPMEKHSVNIRDFTEEIISLFEPIAEEKNIELQAEFSEKLVHVTMDPDRIRQVVGNLFTNAIRHTPDGGQIVIRWEEDENTVFLAVEDTGEGMTREEADSIFTRFYRSDNAKRRDAGGTGLGLAIAKGIIESHGGHAAASSDGINKGSTFTITLPKIQSLTAGSG